MKYPKLRELKEAIRSLFSKPATTKYPFGEAEIHPRFKGKPMPQETCIGCGACVNWCPADAIELIDDVKNKKRTLIWHYDRCIMCGECERICTTEDGVKMVPDFALAGFKRENLCEKKECELVLCENCGEIIATKEQILWCLEKVGEKQTANLGFLNLKLKELGIVEDTKRKIKLDRRDDLFVLLCPKCRHQVIINDSL